MLTLTRHVDRSGLNFHMLEIRTWFSLSSAACPTRDTLPKIVISEISKVISPLEEITEMWKCNKPHQTTRDLALNGIHTKLPLLQETGRTGLPLSKHAQYNCAPPVGPGYQAIRHLCFSVPLPIVTMSLKAVVGQRKFDLFSQPFSATRMIPNT